MLLMLMYAARSFFKNTDVQNAKMRVGGKKNVKLKNLHWYIFKREQTPFLLNCFLSLIQKGLVIETKMLSRKTLKRLISILWLIVLKSQLSVMVPITTKETLDAVGAFRATQDCLHLLGMHLRILKSRSIHLQTSGCVNLAINFTIEVSFLCLRHSKMVTNQSRDMLVSLNRDEGMVGSKLCDRG